MRDADGSHEPYVDFLLGIEDVSCLVADALRELGVGGAVGLPAMFPSGSRRRACGPAFTVRYQLAPAAEETAKDRDGAVDFDFRRLFARARRGDMALLECQETDLAILGSMGVTWAKHFGVAGCIVNGAVRDVEALAASEMPVWARHVTPMAGRGKVIQGEVGGPVSLSGLRANPGDVVVADGNGVAVIPAVSLSAVLLIAADLQRAETASKAAGY